jgi:hypothetical protein
LKADLAALSACETARDRTSAGKGMIGLTWALFIESSATANTRREIHTPGGRKLGLLKSSRAILLVMLSVT